MRKEISAYLDTLKKSVVEIALSGVDNREELLNKSVDQFEGALLEGLGDVLPAERAPLAMVELEPIAQFGDLLDLTANRVTLIKNAASADVGAQLDRFLDVGIAVMRGLVNASGTLPETDAEMNKAERDGQLVKIQTLDGDTYMVKSDLPRDYDQFFTDPVDLLTEYALLGREFSNQAIQLADELDSAEMLPEAIVTDFPELFEPAAAEPPALGKAAFGRRDPGDDENVGDGGDPDAADDPGDAAGNDDAEPDLSDDSPQNPVEMMVRLASIIVVVGGSVLQAQGQSPDLGAPSDANDANDASDASGIPDDTSRQPAMARRAPSHDIGETPLTKIEAGEVAVHPSIADALEERVTLRKQMADTTAQLATLQATVERLSKVPVPPRGALFAVSKSGDSEVFGGAATKAREEAERIEKMAAEDPDAAAKLMLKQVHAGGGVPMVPAN